MSELLKFTINNRVGLITLNRPEKLNAFTPEMKNAWLAALEECRTSDEVNVIVITGTGRAFCTGGDVSRFAEHSHESLNDVKERVVDAQLLAVKIEQIDKPVIAAMNGLATGGGLDVALMCDIRFAAASARFAETYGRMGMIPGAGGAYYLPRVVGLSKALHMFWTSEFVDAQESLRIGLVDKVFPDDELMAETIKYAERIAAGAPLAMRLTKRIVYQGLDTDLKTALNLVASTMPIVRTSEDHREAVAAFQQKRQPKFKGR